MRVRSLIALSFFAACAAIAADDTSPAARPSSLSKITCQFGNYLRVTKGYLRMAMETSSPTSINTRVRALSAVVAHKANNDINGIRTADGPSRDFWLQIRGACFLTT
jgi:hypothetical protein